jgi:hypothetical protein
VAPILRKIHAAGVATSYNDVANRLNHAKIPTYGPQQGRTRPGGPIWHTAIVRRIMQQLGLPDPQCAGRRRIRATRPSTAQRDAAIAPVIRELIAAGASDFHAIAAALNEAAHTTHSGQGLWHPGSVSKVMRRLGLSSSCASGAGHRKKSRQPWSPETYRGFARPPFGWRLAESGEGLVEVEHEQMVIAAICALRAAGGSYRAIARQIDEQHGVKFSSSIIMGILDRAAGVTNQPTSRRDRPHRVPDYSARSARSARTIAVRNAAGDSVVAPVIRDLLANGAASLNDIVTSLNERGIPTYSNRGHWHQATLLKVMQRLGLSSPWTGPAKNLRRPWQPPAQSETRSGRPSFGWHRPKDGFVEDVTEQAVITAICEMRAAGSSYNAIARQIGEQYGLTLPTATVMRILERAAGVTAQR